MGTPVDPRKADGSTRAGARHQVNLSHKPMELQERLNISKEKRVVTDRKDEEAKKIKCFRCQESGHHQKDCLNKPICYKCKEEGHMAIECNEFHSKAEELKMFGFALSGQGYYNTTIPGEGGTSKAASIIQVIHGHATEKKIEEELKNLVNRQWD
jgi:hypothetical protein